MAIFASSDGNGNVTVYGASAISDGQGHVTLLADEVEEGEVIAEDEVSLSLVDTSGYASKSEMQQTAESITATVSAMRIGGRNYAALSNLKRYAGGALYDELRYYTVEGTRITATEQVLSNPLPGFAVYTDGCKEFTISGYSDLSKVKGYYKCFDADGAEAQAQTSFSVSPDADGFFSHTFSGLADGTAYFNIGIGSDQVSDYYLDKLKIEKGGKATDWTPAPEDVEGHTNASVEEALSQIQQLADKLSMLVVDDEGTTLLEQTSEGWTFNMADVLDGVSANADAAAAAAEELEKLAAYIRITAENNAPVLELGNEGEFKTQVTNEELRFMHGDEKKAYINHEAMHIERAVIDDKLNLGGFALYESDDDGLAIVWEGGGE